MSKPSPDICSHAVCSWRSDHPTKPVWGCPCRSPPHGWQKSWQHISPQRRNVRQILSWMVNVPSLKPFWDTLTLPQMWLWRLLTAWTHFHFGERRIYHLDVPASSVPGSAMPRTPSEPNCANNGKERKLRWSLCLPLHEDMNEKLQGWIISFW